MTAGGEEVSPLNIPAWRRFPLRARLAQSTGLPTFVDNDAKALALGEGWRGAAVGETDFIVITVSTGVGGGIVLGGQVLDGAGGNAGHIGHVVVEPDGRPCRCGGRGCLEAEASGLATDATARPTRRPVRSTTSGPASAGGWPVTAAMAKPDASASRHPRPPHRHGRPSGSTTTWPM